jgi:hypothetical protein
MVEGESAHRMHPFHIIYFKFSLQSFYSLAGSNSMPTIDCSWWRKVVRSLESIYTLKLTAAQTVDLASTYECVHEVAVVVYYGH